MGAGLLVICCERIYCYQQDLSGFQQSTRLKRDRGGKEKGLREDEQSWELISVSSFHFLWTWYHVFSETGWHTSAYFSTPQHTSAYVRTPQHTSVWRMLTYVEVEVTCITPPLRMSSMVFLLGYEIIIFLSLSLFLSLYLSLSISLSLSLSPSLPPSDWEILKLTVVLTIIVGEREGQKETLKDDQGNTLNILSLVERGLLVWFDENIGHEDFYTARLSVLLYHCHVSFVLFYATVTFHSFFSVTDTGGIQEEGKRLNVFFFEKNRRSSR